MYGMRNPNNFNDDRGEYEGDQNLEDWYQYVEANRKGKREDPVNAIKVLEKLHKTTRKKTSFKARRRTTKKEHPTSSYYDKDGGYQESNRWSEMKGGKLVQGKHAVATVNGKKELVRDLMVQDMTPNNWKGKGQYYRPPKRGEPSYVAYRRHLAAKRGGKNTSKTATRRKLEQLDGILSDMKTDHPKEFSQKKFYKELYKSTDSKDLLLKQKLSQLYGNRRSGENDKSERLSSILSPGTPVLPGKSHPKALTKALLAMSATALRRGEQPHSVAGCYDYLYQGMQAGKYTNKYEGDDQFSPLGHGSKYAAAPGDRRAVFPKRKVSEYQKFSKDIRADSDVQEKLKKLGLSGAQQMKYVAKEWNEYKRQKFKME
jgi:hypothetical protein